MRQIIPVLFVLALGLPGCAFTNEKNRPLTTALDKVIAPEDTGAQVALAPVAIPVGTASLLLDVLVLHPAQVVPATVDDTYRAIWKEPSGTYVTQAFLFVPKVVVTPVVFVVGWLGRSLFDVGDEYLWDMR